LKQLSGETISKEKLTSEEIKILVSKTESIQNQFKETHVTLMKMKPMLTDTPRKARIKKH
jgi:hypothetical protein